MITSEQAQSKKPDARIFNYAMELAGASAEESLMIGDDLDVDIIGAREIGMDTILFDPFDLYQSREDSTPRVTNIPEILTILDRLN